MILDRFQSQLLMSAYCLLKYEPRDMGICAEDVIDKAAFKRKSEENRREYFSRNYIAWPI